MNDNQQQKCKYHDECGNLGWKVEDPYQAEIYDRKVEVVLCYPCHRELLRDV